MALVDNAFYVNFGDGSTTGYYAVTRRVTAAATAVAAGVIRRQFTAPAVGSERVFICIIAGTTANAVDATWVLTRGATTVDGTVTWMECTGVAAVNGDATNTPNWTTVKNTAITQGQVIKRVSGTSYQICTTAGTAGNAAEPAFSDTAGVTTADNTATWTSLGVVGNFTGGQAPHARIANAMTLTWAQAGNKVFVGDTHREIQTTSTTIAGAGTEALPISVICHSAAGSYPPTSANVTTGAQVQNNTQNISLTGIWYMQGISFRLGSGQASAGWGFTLGINGGAQIYENCDFQVLATGTGAFINLIPAGSSNGYIEWRNTPVKFGSISSTLNWSSTHFVWKNTSPGLMSGSSAPTAFIHPTSTSGWGTNMLIEGVDLSVVTGTLFGYNDRADTGLTVLKDCKLAAGVVLTTTPFFRGGPNLDVIRCDSGATNYRTERYRYGGTETTEVTITRVGGAVHPDGQLESRKIVTNANVSWQTPLASLPLVIWNATVGSAKTVTVEGTINAGAVPNNDELWMEVEYLGSTLTPQGSFATTTKANIQAAGAADTTSASSWNGGGSGAGWSPFKMAVTITPQMAGYIYVRVYAGKASTTYYIDPMVTLS